MQLMQLSINLPVVLQMAQYSCHSPDLVKPQCQLAIVHIRLTKQGMYLFFGARYFSNYSSPFRAHLARCVLRVTGECILSDGRKKAQLVAKGFSQLEGINFNEIFSPVVRFETVRLMLALSSLEDWHMEAVDVKTAFLYRKLNEEIYMQQPEGFKLRGQEHKVLRLLRAIYGLKQAALAWWKELESSMKRLGFKRSFLPTSAKTL